ncbi:uncharacterized protein N7473_012753 [Penicillium subrubescens]|uniref:uncharacterized protein n=1 Tax=Penicillium subrubescens TaxID=1316194 RepID=UPI00254501D3|nr:uncharacterized protein N7473_012753 [Penicillium subrubescens]KAJ5875406.1 hypothetical protein N7473_012753 [Penicillium subrubescens]
MAKNGTLTREIERFYAIPGNSRGGYFPWFLRNQHILENSTPPIEKRYCFIFYALAVDSSIPNPNSVELDLWYDFGFALCTDEYHEKNLGALYSKLVGGESLFRDYDTSLGIASNCDATLPTCSFDEFWRAWRDGTMADLFDKYSVDGGLDGDTGSGLGRNIGFHHLREFLAFPFEKHELRPSLWRLKHLLALDDNTPLTGFPEIVEASHEYGFTPQIDAQTRINLRQSYRELLDTVDPLEVHRAMERGELLGCSESQLIFVGERARDVLQKMNLTRLKKNGGISHKLA